MRIGKSRGSYLPILSIFVSNTSGNILELGVGFCSTPYLHWNCYPKKRKLVSYENNPEYYSFARSWEDNFHEIYCISSWDNIDFSNSWSIAFIDHCPHFRRAIEAKRLMHADYLIIHDSESRNDNKYHLSTVRNLFKYDYQYRGAYPYTCILSNKYDPKEILKKL